MKRLCLAAAISLASIAGHAGELTPYSAEYQVLRGGKQVGTGQRQLQQRAENSYLLHNQVEIRVFLVYSDDRKEWSEFTLDAGNIEPRHYRSEAKTTLKDFTVDLTFDAEQQRIAGESEGEPVNHPWEAGLLDPLSYQQQLAQDLLAGKQELTYRFVQQEKIKTYRFKRVGLETLQTPYGEIEALRVDRVHKNDRRTHIWLWPQNDYLLVRLQQFRKGKEQVDLQLEAVDFGRP